MQSFVKLQSTRDMCASSHSMGQVVRHECDMDLQGHLLNVTDVGKAPFVRVPGVKLGPFPRRLPSTWIVRGGTPPGGKIRQPGEEQTRILESSREAVWSG